MKLRSIASVGCAAALTLTLCVGCTATDEQEAKQSEPTTSAQEAVDVAEDAQVADQAAEASDQAENSGLDDSVVEVETVETTS